MRCRDDAGSMPVAILLTTVATALAGLCSSVVTTGAATVRLDARRPRLLDAAQAGLDIAVGRIRAAVDPVALALNRAAGDDTIPGDRTKLPCGPLSGPVGAVDPATFTVTITYRTVGGTAIACVPGLGTAQTPHHADLSSVGSEAGAQRVLYAEYDLSTTNQNLPGGLIHTYAGPDYCFDAGSAQPLVGSQLLILPCSPGSAEQKFKYTNTLSLVLTSSIIDTRPLGLCVEAGDTPHPAAPTDVPATLQPCVSPTPARQKWSFNSANSFEGTSDGTTNDGHCLRAAVAGQSSYVLLRGGTHACDVIGTNYQNWIPDADAGAGMAGRTVLNLVNYYQFGRCLDVPGFDINHAFMWAWPCKQDPGGHLDWNQKWELCAHPTGPCDPTLPSSAAGESGLLLDRPTPSTQRCLQSPLRNTPWSFPILVVCPASPDPATTWTVYGNTGVYATSYTVVDSAGNCLAVEDSAAPGAKGWQLGRISVTVTVACSGSTREKWNADPNVLRPTPLVSLTER